MMLVPVFLLMPLMSHVEGFDFKRGSNAICDVGDLNDYDHIINIDPTTSDDSNCNSQLFDGQRHMTCPDVNMALKFHADSTAYVFASGANITHYLKQDSMTSFKSQSKVGFFSSNVSELASVKCLDNAGLAFTNVNSVKIHRVVFSYCGVCRNTTSKEYTKKDELYLIEVKVGLYFYNGSDVTMCHVTVQHGPDAVGVVMYDVDGTVNVDTSTFYNNTCSEQSSPGGGGVVIEFSSCVPGNRECMEQTSHNANANYTFFRTTFKSNSANTLTHHILPINKETHEGFGLGGGMAVFFRGNATGNSIEIQSCEFVGNKASSGGGLFIEFGDTSIGNSVDISSAQFWYNMCPVTEAGIGGGGVRITSILDDDSTKPLSANVKGNRVNISGSFYDNEAEKGGAISFSPAFQTQFLKHQTTALNIVDSIFHLNRALVGAAVHLEIHPLFVWGIVNFVTIKNSDFLLNSVTSNSSDSGTRIGVVYASQVPVRFQSDVDFASNYGTALALVSTFATFFDSYLTFENNRGDTGGGIALIGSSHAIVSNTTNMKFEGNFAHKGGAIYNFIITRGNMKVSSSCFIQNQDPLADMSSWGAKFTFINNTSTDPNSNSIFSTSVYPCLYGHIEPKMQLSDALLFCKNENWLFIDANCSDEIETEGNLYKFNMSALNVYPGKGFTLPISVYDDLGHDITDSVEYTSTIPTANNSQLAQVDPRFKLVSANFIIITGLENTTVSVELQSSGSRPHYLQIEVNLLECPPGFHFTPAVDFSTNSNNSSTSGQCTCKPYSYENKVICSIEEFKAQIVWNYWIGVDPSNKTERRLLVNRIPDLFTNVRGDYNDNDLLVLPSLYTELDDKICGIMNRTGVICGECKENFSTAINSYDFICTPCGDETNFTKNIILYMLFAYVPYIILLGIIVLFNLKLASSAYSGFILFAQMMSLDVFNISGSSHVGGIDNLGMHDAYRFVYGLLNFNSFANLMHPFCIGKNFTALDVLCLEYTLAVLPLFLIILLIFLIRCKSIRCVCCCKQHRSFRSSLPNSLSSRKKHKKDGNSLIHAFVAFILLSYTKLAITSMKMVAVQILFNENGNGASNLRLYFAGHLTFFSTKYFFPYGLVAILVLVFFVLPPPLFLLGLPQLVDKLLDKERFSCLRRVWPTITIHIFLDAFQGFYKPNRRPFAGIYFVFRLVILLCAISTVTQLSEFLIQQFLITIMIVLLAVFRPYQKEVFNIIDIAIFLNLTVINLLSTYVYTRRSITLSEDFYVYYVIQYCLIWLPLVYMLSYLMFKLLVKLGIYQLITSKLQKHLSTSQDRQYLTNNSEVEVGTQDVYLQSSEHDSLSDSALFNRAKNTNTFNPSSATSSASERKKRMYSMLDEEKRPTDTY